MNLGYILTFTFKTNIVLALLTTCQVTLAQQLCTPKANNFILPVNGNFGYSLASAKLPMVQTIAGNTQKEKHTKHDYDLKSRGYINITEASYAHGIGFGNEDYSVGLTMVNGYQFNQHFSLGIGIGVDKYRLATLMPVTFDLRTYFLKSIVSPVLILNGGYSVGLVNSVNGHIIHPQIGLKAFVTNTSAFLFNIGYKIQTQQYRNPDIFRYSSPRTGSFEFATISMGFSF